jgi:hypothetical protein
MEVLDALGDPVWTVGQMDKADIGEDVDFCRRVREKGFQIWCDLDVGVGHKIIGTVWPYRTDDGWVTALVVGNKVAVYLPAPTVPKTKE